MLTINAIIAYTNNDNEEDLYNIFTDYKLSNNKLLGTLTRIFDPGHLKMVDREFYYSYCNKTIHVKKIGLKYAVKLFNNVL